MDPPQNLKRIMKIKVKSIANGRCTIDEQRHGQFNLFFEEGRERK